MFRQSAPSHEVPSLHHLNGTVHNVHVPQVIHVSPCQTKAIPVLSMLHDCHTPEFTACLTELYLHDTTPASLHGHSEK